MMRLIFSNRWIALIWVALVAASVIRFAGKDGYGLKAVEKATERARQQKAEIKMLEEGKAQVRETHPLADEPELGEGYDPNPPETLY
jgi:hypothetical protein